METKTCCRCKKELPATAEYFDKNANYGFQPYCRICIGTYKKPKSITELRKRTGSGSERVNNAIRKCLAAEIREWNELVLDEYEARLAEDAHHFRVVWAAAAPGFARRGTGGQQMFYLDEEGEAGDEL